MTKIPVGAFYVETSVTNPSSPGFDQLTHKLHPRETISNQTLPYIEHLDQPQTIASKSARASNLHGS